MTAFRRRPIYRILTQNKLNQYMSDGDYGEKTF